MSNQSLSNEIGSQETQSPDAKQRVSFVALGCKVNQYETQAFRESFMQSGNFAEAGRKDAADVVVVNACVVTHRAEAESKSVIRRALRKNPNARVIATGCLTDKTKDYLKTLPNVEVVNSTDKNQVPVVGGVVPAAEIPNPSSVQNMQISTFNGRARAFVKVQDGCGLNCSFCIIPKVRGKLRSRKIEDVAVEVENLASNGYREIVLTGVHLGHFGRGKGERERFPQLLTRLSQVEGIERIRLSSIESVELRPAVLDALCSSDKFVPHFHLPLQSGNDRVLKAMRRRYTVAEFMAGVEELWKRFDRPSLSTDVIIGFPTETEAEFVETLEIMRAAGFGRSHVFSYSDRAGTDAEALTPKVAPNEIKERTRRAIELGQRLAWKYSHSFLDQPVYVLAETHKDGKLHGYSERYIRVQFEGPQSLIGDIVPVRLTSIDAEGNALAELLTEQNQSQDAGVANLLQRL